MTKAAAFLAELEQEAVATRKLLERVPLEKADWKPHKKSMPLQRLSTHIAEIPAWFAVTLLEDELDFAKSDNKPFIPKSSEDLLAFFDKNIDEAKTTLKDFSDEQMAGTWTMRTGEEIYFTLPKDVVVRTWCFNHWYHHRAQLGVYLRLLDIPLPSTYGPSADTQEMASDAVSSN